MGGDQDKIGRNRKWSIAAPNSIVPRPHLHLGRTPLANRKEISTHALRASAVRTAGRKCLGLLRRNEGAVEEEAGRAEVAVLRAAGDPRVAGGGNHENRAYFEDRNF